ncbi:MAG: GNAT family N-acetyltransferase [Bacilli bacterium]|nr:GNAT family N-acetyltransferase [Bacilli bacterium]
MIIELNRENLEELENNSFLSKETVEKDFDSNPFGKYLILKENQEIIGYLYYSDIYERAEINQIEINSIHRNCGKGSKLLEKMILLVDKNITLEVKEDNVPAIKLYKKFGFEEKAIRKGYYNGVDGILMERKKTL